MCMALTGTLDAKTAVLSEDRLLILGKTVRGVVGGGLHQGPCAAEGACLGVLAVMGVALTLAAIRSDLNRVYITPIMIIV